MQRSRTFCLEHDPVPLELKISCSWRTWKTSQVCLCLRPQALASHRAYLLTARVPSKVGNPEPPCFTCPPPRLHVLHLPSFSSHPVPSPVMFFLLLWNVSCWVMLAPPGSRCLLWVFLLFFHVSDRQKPQQVRAPYLTACVPGAAADWTDPSASCEPDGSALTPWFHGTPLCGVCSVHEVTVPRCVRLVLLTRSMQLFYFEKPIVCAVPVCDFLSDWICSVQFGFLFFTSLSG